MQAADAERIKLATEAKVWQATSESLRHRIELEAQKFEAAVVTGAVPDTSEAATAVRTLPLSTAESDSLRAIDMTVCVQSI